MSNPDRSSMAMNKFLQWIVFVLLGLTTLVITINSYDSATLKTPLLVILASLLLAVFFAQAIWRQRLELRPSTADISVLIFLILILVSVFISKDTRSSEQSVAVWISFIICFFAGTHLFHKQQSLDKFVSVLAIISSIVSLVGLIQFFFGDRLFLEFFIGSDRRITSTLTNATYLSGYVVLLFPTLLAFTMAKERTIRQRWALGTLLCSLVFVLIATSTRSSIAAFAMSIVLFGLLSGNTGRKTFLLIVIGVLGVAAVAAYLSPNLVKRIEASFNIDQGSTFARRLYFWEAGREAFSAAPLIGHGIGSYEAVMLEYRSPEYWVVKSEDIVPHAHNEFIETAVELGGAGLVCYCIILGILAVAGARSELKENERERILRVGLLCSLAAIVIDNLANMSLRVVPVGATAWLLMGVLASFPSRKLPEAGCGLRLARWSAGMPLVIWLMFVFWYGPQQLNIYRADGHIIKGILAGRANSVAVSIREYEHAVALNPHSLIAHSNLTLSFIIAGRPEEAVKSARQLRALSPHYPKSNLMEAAALISLRRFDEALQRIDVELSLRSHPDAYYYQAMAFKGAANTTGELSALEHFLRACIKGQIPYQLRLVSSRVLELAQQEQDIRRIKLIYEQLLSLFPLEPSLKSTLAELHARVGKTMEPTSP